MNIVFLTLGYPGDIASGGLYPDLMTQLARKGHSVVVYRQDETRFSGKPEFLWHDTVKVVSIPSGKITKTRFLQKTINLFLYEKKLSRVIERINENRKIDLLMYSTPPINFNTTVVKLKKKYACLTYLLLKDIFPQNAVDLGLFTQKSPIFFHFKKKESRLYTISDMIGCMSPANKEYLLAHNSEISSEKIHISPNCIFPSKYFEITKEKKVLQSMGIPSKKMNIVYGGNLGKPQGIPFLIEIISLIESRMNTHLAIIGNGTEYEVISRYIKQNAIRNTCLFPFMEKKAYIDVLKAMDIGLVLLDARFSIPNFPSRLLDYLDCCLPILACTDIVCDVKQQICDEGAGVWCKSGDLTGFENCVNSLEIYPEKLQSMGCKAKQILLAKYTCTQVVETIEHELKKMREID